MQAHYLEALEIESKAQKPLAEMERQDFINTITELKAMISSLKLTIDTLRQTISSQNATIASLQESMDRLQCAYDKAVKDCDELNNRMNRSNQETYCSKSLKQSNRSKSVRKDRQRERDEWSSKDDDDNNSSSTSSSVDNGIDQTKVKSENLSRSKRDGMKYNRMNAAKTTILETSLDGVPEDMKFIGYKDIEEYTKKSYVECTVFKVAVYEDKYGIRHEYYHPKDKEDGRRPNLDVIPSTHCTPEFLSDLVVDHFMLMTPIYRQSVRNVLDKLQISRNTNRNWLAQGAEMLTPILHLLRKRLLKVNLLNRYTPEQIKKRRHQKDVSKILGLIYKKANELLCNPQRYHYSEMMRKALVYVTSNWNDLLKYRNDGHYTIDNMLAERAVRPFTVKRKNSLFFSSEDGIKSALKYHTLIETCKNVGLNVKEYFTYVFRKLIEGEKDYEKLLPGAVAL